MTKGLLEGLLCDLHGDKSCVVMNSCEKDDEGRSGADQEIDEDTRHRYEALDGRVLDIR